METIISNARSTLAPVLAETSTWSHRFRRSRMLRVRAAEMHRSSKKSVLVPPNRMGRSLLCVRQHRDPGRGLRAAGRVWPPPRYRAGHDHPRGVRPRRVLRAGPGEGAQGVVSIALKSAPKFRTHFGQGNIPDSSAGLIMELLNSKTCHGDCGFAVCAGRATTLYARNRSWIIA